MLLANDAPASVSQVQAAVAASPTFRWTDVITIVALVAGPLLAVWVGQFMQERSAQRRRKEGVFATLMMTRTEVLSPDFRRALAQIDVVFPKATRVRERWAQYFETLSNPGLATGSGPQVRLNALNDLLAEMAKHLGYKDIGYREITRAYSPQGVVDERNAQTALRDELLRVLSASESFGPPRSGGATPIRPPAPPPPKSGHA